MAYTTIASLVNGRVMTASYLNDIAANFNTLSLHNHSGSLGEGNSTIVAGSGNISGSLSYRTETFGSGSSVFNPALNINYQDGFPDVSRSFQLKSSCLPRGIEWGFGGTGASTPGSGMYIKHGHYLQTGSYIFDIYYLTGPSSGVATILVDNTSVVILELDLYGSTASSQKASGSFYNNGSSLIIINFVVSSSKNASSTGCRLGLGPYSIRWSGN